MKAKEGKKINPQNRIMGHMLMMICRTTAWFLICLCHVFKCKFGRSRTINNELKQTVRQAVPATGGARVGSFHNEILGLRQEKYITI